MKLSERGLSLIKEFEGFSNTAYKCPAGVWTIGYGHTETAKQGMVITTQEAEVLLKQNIKIYEQAVNAQKLNINQNQFDALVSFTYNVGIGNFNRSTLLKKVKQNPQDETIRDEFTKWTSAKGLQMMGLVRRRLTEAELYFLT